jgi:hypothetical protein
MVFRVTNVGAAYGAMWSRSSTLAEGLVVYVLDRQFDGSHP